MSEFKAPAFIRALKYQDINQMLHNSDPEVRKVCHYFQERIKDLDEALQMCAATIDKQGGIIASLANVLGAHNAIADLVEGGMSMQDAVKKMKMPVTDVAAEEM